MGKQTKTGSGKKHVTQNKTGDYKQKTQTMTFVLDRSLCVERYQPTRELPDKHQFAECMYVDAFREYHL